MCQFLPCVADLVWLYLEYIFQRECTRSVLTNHLSGFARQSVPGYSPPERISRRMPPYSDCLLLTSRRCKSFWDNTLAIPREHRPENFNTHWHSKNATRTVNASSCLGK